MTDARIHNLSGRTRGEHANHYTTDLIFKANKNKLKVKIIYFHNLSHGILLPV